MQKLFLKERESQLRQMSRSFQAFRANQVAKVYKEQREKQAIANKKL